MYIYMYVYSFWLGMHFVIGGYLLPFIDWRLFVSIHSCHSSARSSEPVASTSLAVAIHIIEIVGIHHLFVNSMHISREPVASTLHF